MESKSAVKTNPPTFVQTATNLRDGLVELIKPQSSPEPSAAAQSDSIHGSEAIQLIKVPEVNIKHQVRAIKTSAFAYLRERAKGRTNLAIIIVVISKA